MDLFKSDKCFAESPSFPFTLSEQWTIRQDSSYGQLLAYAHQPLFSVSREIVVLADDGSGKEYFKVQGKFLKYVVSDAEGEVLGILQQNFSLDKTAWQAVNKNGEVLAQMVLDHAQNLKNNLTRGTWVTTVQVFLVYCQDALKGKIMVRKSPSGRKCAADFSFDKEGSLDRRLALGMMLVACS